MQNDGKGVTEKNTMEFVNVGRDMQVGHDTFHDYFFIDLMYDGMLFKQRYKWEDTYFLQSWIWLSIMMHILFRRKILPKS